MNKGKLSTSIQTSDPQTSDGTNPKTYKRWTSTNVGLGQTRTVQTLDQ